MALQADAGWIVLVLLVALRVAPIFIMTPVFGSAAAPALFRGALVVALAAAIAGAAGAALPRTPESLDELLRYACTELAIGAALAFGLGAAFAAFQFGGRLLDFQFGFSVVSLIDPATRSHAPLIGTALNLAAVAAFFVLGGHHMLVRALAFSLEHFPPGRSPAELNFAAIGAQFGAMFTLGLAIAAPALFAVLLLDIGFAVASRSMPQMNVFIVAIPFKIALGLIVLAASLHYLGAVMQKAFESVFRYWAALLS